MRFLEELQLALQPLDDAIEIRNGVVGTFDGFGELLFELGNAAGLITQHRHGSERELLGGGAVELALDFVKCRSIAQEREFQGIGDMADNFTIKHDDAPFALKGHLLLKTPSRGRYIGSASQGVPTCPERPERTFYGLAVPDFARLEAGAIAAFARGWSSSGAHRSVAGFAQMRRRMGARWQVTSF